MEDKKTKTISLGTAICIFIIIVLVIALSVVYYIGFIANKQESSTVANNKNDIVNSQTNESKINVVANSQNDENTTEINSNNSSKLQYPIENKTYFYKTTADEKYQISFSNNEFTAKVNGMTVIGNFKIVNPNEIECNIMSYSWYEEVQSKSISLEKKGWYVGFEVLDNSSIKANKCYFGEGETEIQIGLFMAFGEKQEYKIYELNYSIDNKIYSYKNDANEKHTIEFSNNKFTAQLNNITVIGDVQTVSPNEIECNIKEYSWNDSTTSGKSLENKGWYVRFSVLDNSTIQANKCYFGENGETEIQIGLFMAFGEKQEYKTNK